jgi:hypothetical protein
LRQAREHEKPRRLEDLPTASLFPNVEVGRQFLYDHEQLLLGLNYSLARSARADRTLDDQDIIAALSALAKTRDTLVNAGLHYPTQPSAASQQAVAADLEKTVAEYRALEQKHRGYSSLLDSELLRAFVFLLRMAEARTSGRPKSRAFIDSLFAQFPQTESALVTADQAGSRIIVP